jgi:O-antigen/teichoic acid export membrane protein
MGTIIGYAVAGVSGVVLLRIVLPKAKSSAGVVGVRGNVKSLMQFGAPLYVVWLLIGIVPLFQNLILANFTTDVNVGNFKAASNFAVLMTVLSIPITNAMLSAFSRFDSVHEQGVKLFFRRANKYTALIVFPVTTIFIIFSNEIVRLVYGSTYEYAALFLAAYCLVYFLAGFGYLNLASFFNGLGKTRTTLEIGLITFVIIAVLSPIFTQLYGVLGLIGVFVVANAIGTSYGAYIAKKKFSATFDVGSISKLFVISLICAIPAVLVRNVGLAAHFSLAIGGLIYLVLYLTLVPAVRTVTESELTMLNGTMQKIGLLRIIGKVLIGYQRKILSLTFDSKRKKQSSPVIEKQNSNLQK